MCIVFMFSACSCYIGADARERRIARKTALKLFKYMQEEDTDNLVRLFAKETKKEYDLEDEWEELFDSLDGTVKSYGKLEVTASEVWVDKGKVSYSVITVSFNDVVTDEGTRYDEIFFSQTVVDKAEKDMIGINALEIFDEDEESVAVVGGYGEDY